MPLDPIPDIATVIFDQKHLDIAEDIRISHIDQARDKPTDVPEARKVYTRGAVAVCLSTGRSTDILPRGVPKPKWTINENGFTINPKTLHRVRAGEELWLKVEAKKEDWLPDLLVAVRYREENLRSGVKLYIAEIYGTITGERFREERTFEKATDWHGPFWWVAYPKLDPLDRDEYKDWPR